uniref:Uncharacterized protein n=1 Tax=Cucumis melo TaxID=3656 RepID=A0A9I9CY22_CUCME
MLGNLFRWDYGSARGCEESMNSVVKIRRRGFSTEAFFGLRVVGRWRSSSSSAEGSWFFGKGVVSQHSRRVLRWRGFRQFRKGWDCGSREMGARGAREKLGV